ncbi:hypothetical protein EXW96_23185 [Paenibacillus sp. JMULE4]|nr:hypothetical protein [Paenibacillus sp. JMULE4]
MERTRSGGIGYRCVLPMKQNLNRRKASTPQGLHESYTDSLIEDGRFEPYIIMEGHLFVMGDNRHRYASNDSRSFGAVPLSEVEGRAEMIVWPPKQWRSL